jgi:hypothetical protein
MMADAKKSAEAVRKIQDTQRTIVNHKSNISRIERERGEKIKYFDQQIAREQAEINRHTKLIEELKRQI